jgi:hypothetical protein
MGSKNRGGEWEVKRGECGAVSGRGWDAGAAHALEATVATVFGWLHSGEEGSQAGPTR